MNSQDYSNNIELILENRREILSKLIRDLSEKLSGISFDEEGNIVGDLDKKLSDITFDEKGNVIGTIEQSAYFLNANRSADDFRLIIINNKIEKQKMEIKQLEEKQKISKQYLEDQKKLLSEKDAEIYRLDVEILASDRNDPKSFVDNTNELIIQRSKREELIKLIERLSVEVKASTKLNRAAIKVNKELVKSLTKEYETIKAKTLGDYIDYEKLNEDLAELNNAKKVLDRIEQTQNVFKSVEQDNILETTEGKVIEPSIPAEDRPKEEVPHTDSTKPEEVPSTDSEKPEEIPIIPPEKPEEVPSTDSEIPGKTPDILPEKLEEHKELSLESRSKEWKMPGFLLDFIERFGYIPGDYERNVNADYKGDYNSLRTNYAETDTKRIVVRIKNAAKSFAASVNEWKSKRFASRRNHEIDISNTIEPNINK